MTSVLSYLKHEWSCLNVEMSISYATFVFITLENKWIISFIVEINTYFIFYYDNK